jgi:hypothetical protein
VRRASTWGRHTRNTLFRHWLCRLDGVTMKLTKVTREHRSGENWAVLSRVVSMSMKVGEKSTSMSSSRTNTRPPA